MESHALATLQNPVLDITDKWLEELRDQVSDSDLAGVEIVMWFLRTKQPRQKK